jgi:uroporphyrinogen-III synthase
LVEALHKAGYEPVVVPTIAIEAPSDFVPLDAALRELDGFDWLVFTSANGVESFARRLGASTVLPKIAAIGPATARAAVAAGLVVSLVPKHAVGESLAAALVAEIAPGTKRFLLVRAEQAREVVPQVLRAAAAEVVEVAAYRTVVPEESVERVRAMFAEREAWPAAVVFTSGSTAVNLAALLESAGVVLPKGVRRISIGPITSAALRELGWVVDAEAEETTVESLIKAVAATV